jgi:Starch-binding associating with outer membrane
MKNIYLKFGAILLLAVLIGSCEKWIDPKINEDPDSVVDVPYNLLLPSIEVDLGYVLGGMDVRGITGMWVQHVAGQARQAATMGKNYNLTEADVNNLWNSLYNGSMMDLTIFIGKTGDANPQARGAGKVLLAYALGSATDLWGDIPYAEAFKGNDNLKPKYDTQQNIYTVINTLLTEAIADLGTANTANAIPFGSSANDLIYNGNIPKWIAAAHSLRARYALHLSKKANVDYTAILADCAAGISSNANDFQMPFGTTESNANPLYQFDVQRTDVAPSASFAAFAAGDPRLVVFAGGGRNFGTFYGSIASPVPFITYVETKFIEAEAQLRKASPSQPDANAAYDAAVTASLAKFNVTDAAWLTANTTGVLGDRSLQNIIEAKYIALFMQTEAFTDFRRTGWPVLVPTAGTKIPVRYPYCTDERLYNSENVPTGITVDSPLWWMSAK